ncbi:hypothetical protein D3C81_193550 [compost metagenome]
MARYIEGGALAFNELAYAPRAPETLQFLQDQAAVFSQNLTATGRAFMQTATAKWDQYFGENAMRAARAAVRSVQTMWDADVIRTLTSIAQMQHAPQVMQRYIMADPFIRDMFLQQKLDGYSDTYVNKHGNAVGHAHYDYRRLMNGVVQEREDGAWEAWTFWEELEPGDVELKFDEQFELIDSIGNIVRKIRQGKDDPTSRYNSSL